MLRKQDGRKELGKRKMEGGCRGVVWRELWKLGKDKLRSLGSSGSCESLRLRYFSPPKATN
jgi:hypothetical protein